MIASIVPLNCILNDIAWDQAPWWGKKKKEGVKLEKYHIATCNFHFSVSDYVYTLLLQTCDYVLQQVQTLSSCNHLTIYIFSPITSIYLLFSLRHYLLPFHPLTTNNTLHQ